MEVISEIEGVKALERIGEAGRGYVRYAVKVSGGADVAEAIFRAAVERGWTINELRRETLSLEDIFLKLTTREM
jgi:ABC-2 type transport system ATP-binding protein